MADVASSSGIVVRDPATGRAISLHDPAARIDLAERACTMILAEGKTIKECAEVIGISERTMVMYLMSLPDEKYAQVRRVWIDAKLADALVDIESEDSLVPVQLARAREKWKAVTWLAERRDPARYASAARVDVTSNQPVAPQFHVHIHSADRGESGQVIEGEIPARDGK